MFYYTRIYLLMGIFLFANCTREEAPLGSPENPVKLFFVPSIDSKIIEERSASVKEYLEANTPYKYKISVPNSYIAVVEAFGTRRADVSTLNTFGYVLAHEKYGAEVLLTSVRYDSPTYRAQILARADGPVKKLSDINGRKFAYVDPASTSGYLLPKKLFKDKNIKPKETVFAQRHDNVIIMIQNRQVDAGATYYTPPAKGEIQDARRLVLKQIPDVEKKIKIIELTGEIPNDPIVVRKDLPPEMKEKIAEAFIKFVATSGGKETLNEIFAITALKRATDKDYDGVRQMMKELGEVR
jgi:phosphonate transport system substrate-binding protein